MRRISCLPGRLARCAAIFALCAASFILCARAEDPAPAPTLEQRISALEAYVNNTDPAAVYKTAKDTDGTPAVPEGLTAPVLNVPGPGHNGFMMTSALLVLFMTLPGLALFYGGLVRRKNVLSVFAQCLGIAGLVTILWWAAGYSLVFDKGTPLLGGLNFAFLQGVTPAPNPNYASWVSQNVFAMYQLMFAIITPALIIGAIAERMRFGAVLVFVGVWMFLVYFPLAHMVWGADGFMNGVWNPKAGIKAIDFAGGTVVHMSSGWSALVLCLILGKRIGFRRESFAPHSMVLCMVGASMLWIGWYGFNAGSAVAADGIASNAFLTTTLATGAAAVTWGLVEALLRGKPSVLGFCSGIVAGLVVITPAAGFVTAGGAAIIGVVAGVIPYFAVTWLKRKLNYDDALDTFGIHAVGGTLGAFLTGFLATPEVNPNLAANLGGVVGHTLWLEQLKAMGITLALAVVGTAIIAYAIKLFTPLRPAPEAEISGLDISDHGEEGYIL